MGIAGESCTLGLDQEERIAKGGGAQAQLPAPLSALLTAAPPLATLRLLSALTLEALAMCSQV